MKYRSVLYWMSDISEYLYNLVNSYRPYKENYLYFGKLYRDVKACKKAVGTKEERVITSVGPCMQVSLVRPSEKNIDFRNDNVDDAIAEEGRNFLIERVKDFCDKYRDGDIQTLLLACALNIYYTSGLFDRCGSLSVSLFDDVLLDVDTKRYAKLIEKRVCLLVSNCFFDDLCQHGLFVNDEVNTFLDEYVKCNDADDKVGYMNKILECIEPEAILAKSFAKAILREYDMFDKILNTNLEDLVKEMYSINHSYQFANMLLSMDAVEKFIRSQGADTRFLEYLDKYDNELWNIVCGVKTPSTLDVSLEGNKIVTNHPETFSAFGLGVPFIVNVTEDEFERQLPFFEENDERLKISDCNYIREKLEYYLYVPRKVYVDVNVMRYAMRLALDCKKSEKEKQKALDDKKIIVNRFSHTYMGMRATSLYNIATELIKHDEKVFQDYGRKLLYEYSIKKNLSKDVEMLKLRFEDKIDELNSKLCNSVLEEESEDGVGIQKLISDALTRCMVTLVHDGKAKNVRQGFKDFDLIEIRNDFECDVLLSEKSNIVDWFRNRVFDLKFDISDSWKNILFEDESYAALLIIDIITELIINIFKYADKFNPIVIEFAEDAECLMIKTQNSIRTEIRGGLESGHGLDSEGDAIQVINEINGFSRNAVEYEIKDNLFCVNVAIVRSVFKV